MEAPLDTVAVRVLGSLIEKEITTPDNYPLTLNALVTACNQTSNRDPVMELDEETVRRSINDLRIRSLARGVQRMDSRVMRYSQLVSEKLGLDGAETAVMCVLMLRGAQTAGEIRTRAQRLFEFADVPQVERTLELLAGRRPSPLVTQLPRRPGQKEARFAHLLSGDAASAAASDATSTLEPRTAAAAAPAAAHAGAPAPQRSAPADGRVEALERTVSALREELAELRAQFEAFRKEFL